jgi:putative ABC transport system ATP-binding protein
MSRLSESSRDRSARASGAIVRCADLVREYRRGSSGWFGSSESAPVVRALDGVSLEIPEGAFVGVSGPSGSGKSTLLHLLAGLDEPTAGRVLVDGVDLADRSARERTRLRRDRIGLVFQRFHLLPSLSARGNVALPMIERGIGKRRRRERATELLERVGLGDRITHHPGALSGGEAQRVAVARALANDPDLLLADEPTGELDTATGARVLRLLADLAGDRTVVVASHDDRVFDVADRRVALRDGRVVEGA